MIAYAGPEPGNYHWVVNYCVVGVYFTDDSFGRYAKKRYKATLRRIRRSPEFKKDKQKTVNYQTKYKKNPICDCGLPKAPAKMRCPECQKIHTKEYHKMYKRVRDRKAKYSPQQP